MSTDQDRQYNPDTIQQKWLDDWNDRGLNNADPNPDKPPHTIMIPLPNVTGALHMGHALNGTLQDLVTRWKRMQGFEALWMPGTDHAGIATQAVVERRMLEEEGLTRHDIGRDALVARIWRWKDSYEERILSQLRQLGASCDWRRVRFTLDDVCSRAVRRTFFKLFSDGLIYRGKRLVNWDTHLQTAVADDEVFHDDIDGQFWTFSYPLSDGSGEIVFSTTRPETMLGDTAVCVHPTDDRYADMIGRMVKLPLCDREIPIIADALLAKKDLGTGAVKVTPAHDPNDYACALRNDLPMINILNPDGTVNEHGGQYEGLTMADARVAVTDAMQAAGHFKGVEDRRIPIAHSDRSKTQIEPYLSDQWFVKMDTLAQNAIDAVNDGRVRFFPSRYAKTYLDWLGEKRDWCISRQLWWGHRIPIWSRADDSDAREALSQFGASFEDDHIAFSGENEQKLSAVLGDGVQPGERLLLVSVDVGNEQLEQRLSDAGFQQDPDVLDTWFSSALWPHATLGWPDESHNPPLADDAADPTASDGENQVLDYFYPGSLLITSRDIITLWVARMVLTGLYNMGDIPFAHVHVHPKILDGFGQTMSKSKGNGVDPADLIGKYGVDAVRFTIASFAGETQDVRLPIGYECPHCEQIVEPKLYKMDKLTVVVPKSLKGNFPIPQGAAKPTMSCPKCKQQSQFSTPLYDVDPGADVAKIVSERFDYGRNFCNKLWNASRFVMMNLEGYESGSVAEEQLTLEDRWILSRLSTTTAEVTRLLDRYQFDQATRAIRDFTWNEFCDWYIEMLKPRLRDEAQRVVAQRVVVTVLDQLLRLLHPFAPFITEELWSRLAAHAPDRSIQHADRDGCFGKTQPAEDRVMAAAWASAPAEWIDHALEKRFERLQDTIVAIRNVRSVYNISPGTPMKLFMRCSPEIAEQMTAIADQFDNLSKTILESAGLDVSRPNGSAGFTLEDTDGYIPLEGLIDVQAELSRQKKEADRIRGFMKGHQGKLNNEKFTSKAPPEVVAQVRETLDGLTKQLEGIERTIAELSEG